MDHFVNNLITISKLVANYKKYIRLQDNAFDNTQLQTRGISLNGGHKDNLLLFEITLL